MKRLGIVVGLAAEARVARPLARHLRAEIVVGGGDREGAQIAADQLVRQGVCGLISFGLAGGLDPALRPGAIIVPSAIIAGGKRWDCDPELGALLGGMGPATLYGGAAVLAEAEAKARLHETTGAAAVDLESGAVAMAAARRGLPFAALRAICDPAERDLPRAALIALSAKGRIGLLRVAGAVLRDPAQLPTLLALGRDAGDARRAMRSHIGTLREAGRPAAIRVA